MRGLGALLLGLSGLALAGCASGPSPQALAANDPFEPVNRQVFALNQQVDQHLFLPTVKRYLSLPQDARDSVHNFLRNLATPTIFVNDLLQAEPARAGRAAVRFLINSSLGLGGLFDPATRMGFAYHGEDFGQTLAVWGAGEGPYMVLPFFGPSDPRDAAGLAVDALIDPTNFIRFKQHLWWAGAREYFTYLDLRGQTYQAIQGIQRSSVDYYASLRSLYRQLRNSDIRNGRPEKAQDLPDF
jgi:phospholipid-binding lipoprotein MlaA